MQHETLASNGDLGELHLFILERRAAADVDYVTHRTVIARRLAAGEIVEIVRALIHQQKLVASADQLRIHSVVGGQELSGRWNRERWKRVAVGSKIDKITRVERRYGSLSRQQSNLVGQILVYSFDVLRKVFWKVARDDLPQSRDALICTRGSLKLEQLWFIVFLLVNQFQFEQCLQQFAFDRFEWLISCDSRWFKTSGDRWKKKKKLAVLLPYGHTYSQSTHLPLQSVVALAGIAEQQGKLSSLKRSDPLWRLVNGRLGIAQASFQFGHLDQRELSCSFKWFMDQIKTYR